MTGKLPFLLRALVVGEALFGLMGVFDGFFVSFPPPLQEYLDAQGGQPIGFILIAQAVASLGNIFGLVGLWRFQPWGRIVYTASMLGFYAVFVFDEPVVSSAPGQALQDLSTVCSGGILTLVWTIPFPQSFLQHQLHTEDH
ncbi:MAG: hypothetical protein OEY77_16060 [Nitrospira sp.]|nr:hypothetical protein [Nitrospira sp.]